MKLSKDIFLLDGALRAAAYDLDEKVVYPISEVEKELLNCINQEKDLRLLKGKFESREIHAAKKSLIKKSLIQLGRNKGKKLQPPPKGDKIFKLTSFSHVWIEVTEVCNLQCKHCYSESSPFVSREFDLDYLRWKKILIKLIDFGVQKITFIGGEPLVRKELVSKLISFVKERNNLIELRIFSNLSSIIIDKTWIQILKRNNISIGTSLYGVSPSIHDNFTQNRGSWARTIRNIELLRKENIPVFSGFYIQEEEDKTKYDIATWIESLGISDYDIIKPSKVGRGINLDFENNKLNKLPSSKSFTFGDPNVNAVSHNCYKDVLTIRNNGAVIPCIMTRNVQLPNLLKNDIKEILEDKIYQKYARITKDSIDGCNVCEFRYGCFDCRPDAMQGSENLFSKPNCGYDPCSPLS